MIIIEAEVRTRWQQLKQPNLMGRKKLMSGRVDPLDCVFEDQAWSHGRWVVD